MSEYKQELDSKPESTGDLKEKPIYFKVSHSLDQKMRDTIPHGMKASILAKLAEAYIDAVEDRGSIVTMKVLEGKFSIMITLED